MQPSTLQLKFYRVVLSVVLLIVALDQWTKYLAVDRLANYHVFVIIPNLFDFSLVYNRGAAFGMGNQWPEWLRRLMFLGVSGVAVVVVGCLLYGLRLRHELRAKLAQTGLTLVLGGAVGNLIDRSRFGYVVDFIHVYWRNYHWPNFNVADSCICVGMSLFAFYLLGENNKKN